MARRLRLAVQRTGPVHRVDTADVAPVAAPPVLEPMVDQRRPPPQRDATTEAEALRAALRDGDHDAAIAILAANADPARRYALRSAYGPLDLELYGTLSNADWARARAYLGDQVALEWQIERRRTREDIFADLERVTDAQALALFVPHAVTLVPTSRAPASAPASSDLARVKDALTHRLNADDHDAALRLLLAKAERALGGVGPTSFDDAPLALEPWSAAAELSRARLDLAEEALRRFESRVSSLRQLERSIATIEAASTPPGLPDVGGAGDTARRIQVAASTASLRWSADSTRQSLRGFPEAAAAIVADLSRGEREAMARRLAGTDLGAEPELVAALAAPDDRVVIERALLATGGAGHLGDVAAAAAQRLASRATAAATDGADVDARARYFRDDAEATFAAIAADAPDRPTLVARLRAVGASPEVIARASVATVPVFATTTLLEVLAATPPRARAAAVPDLEDRLRFCTPTERDYLRALLAQGRGDRDMPAGLELTDGYDVDYELVLGTLLDAVGRGPEHAPRALATLHRAGPPLRRRLLDDPRFVAAYDAMPVADQAARDFHMMLGVAADRIHVVDGREVEGGRGQTPADALRMYPGPTGIWQEIVLEELRLDQLQFGTERLKRAWAAREHARARGLDPDAVLTAQDRAALAWLDDKVSSPLLEPGTRAVAEDLVFGQPDFAADDLGFEADFLRLRLARTLGLAPGAAPTAWAAPVPAVIEPVTEFESVYQQRRWGAMTRSDLAVLYQASLRASDAHAAWARARAENEAWARMVATTVAAVVATAVVTVASAGTLTGPTIAALATLAGGVSAATAGAIVRDDDTVGSVATDFGAGAVEGLVAAVGQRLSARVARRIAAGRAAGVAAAEIAGNAVRHTTGVGVAVVEGVVDGALGGAASEVFRTAVDDVEWERGVAATLATLLAALGRGAVEGGLGGAIGAGAMHGLGRVWRVVADTVGAGAADDVVALLEKSRTARELLDAMSDEDTATLARAFERAMADDLETAEKELARLRLARDQRESFLLQLRSASMVSKIPGLERVPKDVDLLPHVVSDREFRRATGGRADRHAAIVMQDGTPRILARRGAPDSALREELVHLAQYLDDPLMALRMRRLDEAALTRFTEVSDLRLRLDQLEVEADAQRRLLDIYGAAVEAGDRRAVADFHRTAEALARIQDQLDLGYAARRGTPIDYRELGFGDDPPRLYATSAPSGRLSRRWHRRVEAQIGRDPDEAADALRKLGYTPHGRHPVLSIHRPPNRGDLPALTIKDGRVAFGEGTLTFDEQKRIAAGLWRSRGEQRRMLDALVAEGGLDAEAAAAMIDRVSDRWTRLLEARVAAGTLDEAGAGLLLKWAGQVEDIEARTGGSVNLSTLLGAVSDGPVTTTGLSNFRKALRTAQVEHVHSLPEGQCRAALDALLDAQPDNASRGHLFSAFRAESFAREVDEFGDPLVGTFDDVDALHGPGLSHRRTPDGAVTITGMREDFLRRGRYAFEDKAGPGAFSLEQARDYARSYDPSIRRRTPGPDGATTGGFRARPGDTEAAYDGIVYTFQNLADAKAAFSLLERDSLTQPLLDKHPGISVFYLSKDAAWERVTP